MSDSLSDLPPDPALVADAALLSAFADPTRLRLLHRLLRGPCCVGDLVEEAEALQPRVSRHLAVLREAGLVACDVDGRKRCYHLLRPDLVGPLLALLGAHRPAPGDPA